MSTRSGHPSQDTKRIDRTYRCHSTINIRVSNTVDIIIYVYHIYDRVLNVSCDLSLSDVISYSTIVLSCIV